MKPTYSRVVYGSMQNNAQDQRTQATEPTQDSSTTSSITSTPSTTSEVKRAVASAIQTLDANNKKDNESLKGSLLEEMRKLNDASSNRLRRLEDSGSKYEQMMEQIHENNLAKANEMASYEKRICQIGKDTAMTAEKVNTTAGKVDKLHTSVKALVTLMTDALVAKNPLINGSEEKQKCLQQLSDFLNESDASEDSGMEYDVEYIPPSPDAKHVLGGEGIQK